MESNGNRQQVKTGGRIGERGAGLAWIFGSSRSGSTWLLKMLADLDRRVVPIDDPHLGHHLGVWRPLSLAWGASAETPTLTTLASLKGDEESYFFAERYRHAWEPALRRLIASRFEAQVAAAGGTAEVAGERLALVKEPGSQASCLLRSLFPESSLVFLLRDGRDVVDSWVDAYQSGSWAIEGGAFPVEVEGRLALVRWLGSVWSYRTRAVLAAFARHDPERRVIIRFEDLRTETAASLAPVARVLGLDRDPERLQRVAERHSFEQIPSSRKGNGQVARQGGSGGWRHNLNEAEQDAMHEVMAAELREVGYLDRSSGSIGCTATMRTG